MFEHMAIGGLCCDACALVSRMTDACSCTCSVIKHASYRFSAADKDDWIAQHYFTGGIMPSRAIDPAVSPIVFEVEAEWHWNGRHYAQTARHWLENFDRNEGRILEILRNVYGVDASLWLRRWRLFFLATIGLFGHAMGEEWGVSHYLSGASSLTSAEGMPKLTRMIA